MKNQSRTTLLIKQIQLIENIITKKHNQNITILNLINF